MSYWYVDRKYLRARTNQASWYDGFKPDAIGDMIFHMALWAIITGDDEILMLCIQLLKEGKRWPDIFNDKDHIAKNRLDKWLHPLKYRWQYGMTRDPIIMVICAMVHLGCVWEKEIYRIKIPWYLQRPNLKNWHKYLSTGEIKYKKKYEFWAGLEITLFGWTYKNYAIHLACWKAYTIDSDKIKKKLHKHIDYWNLLQRLLTGKYTDKLNFSVMISSYIAKIGYQWSGGKWIPPQVWDDSGYWNDDTFWIDGPALLSDDPIKLDKDILLTMYKHIFPDHD